MECKFILPILSFAVFSHYILRGQNNNQVGAVTMLNAASPATAIRRHSPIDSSAKAVSSLPSLDVTSVRSKTLAPPPASGTVRTLRESDGSPTYDGVDTIDFNPNNFALTNPAGNRVYVSFPQNIIVGGQEDTISGGSAATILGGLRNKIQQGGYGVARGYSNTLGTTSGSGDYREVGGANMVVTSAKSVYVWGLANSPDTVAVDHGYVINNVAVVNRFSAGNTLQQYDVTAEYDLMSVTQPDSVSYAIQMQKSQSVARQEQKSSYLANSGDITRCINRILADILDGSRLIRLTTSVLTVQRLWSGHSGM